MPVIPKDKKLIKPHKAYKDIEGVLLYDLMCLIWFTKPIYYTIRQTGSHYKAYKGIEEDSLI
jgi:hypothetical protein